ncbi:hypothetical protein KIN20_011015 [Parelaphostrongylus tenuis]|uniref:Uncharacterized protein n=1 Tax=Parelaphostrongylus tenuis TaxID=148309 RepID=A0AAD5MC85_PARTN|nr:hypothetical protein KIN20_011015 [Parelaphostrongylus tenuis]
MSPDTPREEYVDIHFTSSATPKSTVSQIVFFDADVKWSACFANIFITTCLTRDKRKVDREKHLGDVSPLYQHPTDEEEVQIPHRYR